MARCTGITTNGERCLKEAPPGTASGMCTQHDPAHAERRRRQASMGGKARQHGRSPLSMELYEVRRTLYDLADAELAGHVPTSTATALTQVYNACLRCLDLERQAVSEEGVEARIAALEEKLRGGDAA